MEPISLGIVAAVLFATKVIERLGERAGDKVADSATPLREHIGALLETGHQDQAPLALVERTPDSKIAVNGLAAAITEAAKEDPDSAAALAALIEEIRSNDDSSGSVKFSVNLSGSAEVDSVYQAGRDITFNPRHHF